MPILFWFLIFLASLAVLIKGADFFTWGAGEVGTRLGVSQYIVGITIVSIGTSLPELMTSIVAVLQVNGLGDTTEIVAANVVGSNIANVLVVIGLAALICKRGIGIERLLVKVDLPLLLGATCLAIILLADGFFDWRDAILSLIGYAIYFAFIYAERPAGFSWFHRRQPVGWRPPLFILGGAIAVYLGSYLTIQAVVELAVLLNIAQTVIAMFAVALGTSLPELAVSVQAARRGNHEIAIGNVLGSNMFNLLVILGVPAFIHSLTVTTSTIWLGLPFLALSTLLFIISTIVPHVARVEGALYLLLYVTFIGKLFGLI